MSKQNTVDRFYCNLLDFVDLMLEIIPDDYKGFNWGLLELVKKYIEGYSEKKKKDAVVAFIKNSEKYWSKQIKHRKEVFFIENSSKIFSQFGDKVNVFKSIFTDKTVLTEDDKDTIWQYIESFVKQSVKFIHENRKPTRTLYNQKYQNVYTSVYMKDIDISKHARDWDIKLDWDVV